jgi:hypothetical protein
LKVEAVVKAPVDLRLWVKTAKPDQLTRRLRVEQLA